MTVHTKEYMQEFAQELSDLLEKYEVYIYWVCGDGSDTYGIYDEQMLIGPERHERDGCTITINGSSIDTSELSVWLQD